MIRQEVFICGDDNTGHKEIDLARPKENEKRSAFYPEERVWLTNFTHTLRGHFPRLNQEPGHYTWWDMVTRARERDVGCATIILHHEDLVVALKMPSF